MGDCWSRFLDQRDATVGWLAHPLTLNRESDLVQRHVRQMPALYIGAGHLDADGMLIC
jgi:hypothetical protein